jgi:hypothetical protein
VKRLGEWMGDPGLWALAYARQGYHVLPLRSVVKDGSCDCGRTECLEDPTKRAKHPRTANGWKDASSDEDTIRAWWRTWPTANVGIATVNGLVVVDVDPRHGGDETWAALLRGHELPECPTVRTGSNGWHCYFRGKVGRQGSGALGDGVDVKAAVDGRAGYVVAPPSVTSPGFYAWEIVGVPLPPLPEWLQPAPRDGSQVTVPVTDKRPIDPRYALAVLDGEAQRARARRDGEGRRDGLFEAALRLSHFIPPLDFETVVRVLTAAGIESGLPAGAASMHARNGLKTALRVPA